MFATTLDEKLQCPDVITDERPGALMIAPGAPGRPAGLQFKPSGSGKAEFPGPRRLEQERERGRLLHFFANHELLAVELMALALLRFPDAPAAFRRGVLQTLQDEQRHTRLYLTRMGACGIQFGELPVSGYFWRAISGMETPLDYVAGLSLTFEQANLDFARHFSHRLAVVGDTETARLLDGIYRDEIAHVAHGLKWFRRWKNPRLSDWSAFCRQLKFPLSPSRAKGFALNVEGRRLAGLDPEFIHELYIHSQSKGRTPDVFVLNLFAEGRIAHGKQFAPTKHQSLLALDLGNLPQFLCRQDDIVLIAKRPSIAFLSSLKQAGFPLPEFVELPGFPFDQLRAGPGRPGPLTPAEGPGTGLSALAARKLARLRPWAWAPDSLELFAPLLANVTGEHRTASQYFHDGIAQLYSKAWSAAFLRRVLARCTDASSWLCSRHEVGAAVDTLDEALAAITEIRSRGHHKIVVKEAIGLAGHNALRLWEPALLETQRRWIATALQHRRQLVIEPWLERELDFSMQLEMGPAGLKVCGYTGLINDRRGQFQANWAAPNYRRRLPPQVAAFWPEPGRPSNPAGWLQRVYAEIVLLLDEEFRRVGYVGPVGLDAFVYRAEDGRPRLKPVVEINPRYTMGRLTVELMAHICPGSHGMFRLVNRAMLRVAGFGDFTTYADALRERSPPRLEGEPVPRLREGALCLNDPAQVQVCLALFQARPQREGAPFASRVAGRF